jgi:hypothetical protein
MAGKYEEDSEAEIEVREPKIRVSGSESGSDEEEVAAGEFRSSTLDRSTRNDHFGRVHDSPVGLDPMRSGHGANRHTYHLFHVGMNGKATPY